MPRFIYREGERYFKNCSLFTPVTWILELSQFLPCFVRSLIVENSYYLGLITIARGLGLNLLAPRKKITILLLGNHSAGKSSFINW